MNETFEPYVKKLLDSGFKTAEEAAKFIETQTPELGKEIITWGAVSEMVAPLIGLVIIGAAWFLHFKCRTSKWYTDIDAEFPGIVLCIIGNLVGIIMFLSNIMDVVYPLVAPRIYILEKVASLIK